MQVQVQGPEPDTAEGVELVAHKAPPLGANVNTWPLVAGLQAPVTGGIERAAVHVGLSCPPFEPGQVQVIVGVEVLNVVALTFVGLAEV